MKKIISVLTVICVIFSLTVSCSPNKISQNGEAASSSDVKYDVNIAVLAGPTGIGSSYLLKNSDDGKSLNNYKYDVCSSPDEITAKIVSGEYDIAALPTNVAATLYNKTNGKVKMLVLNTLGVLYLVEKGDSIKSVGDLKGKTVYVSGQGSTPEYALEYILQKNGLKVGTDVVLDFTYSSHADLMAFAATGGADVVLLPEPTVTALLSKNPDMRVAFDLNDLWANAVENDSVMSMGCMVVNTEFANKHPEAVKNFVTEYEQSVNKVNHSPEEASEIIVSLGIANSAPLALKALPRCNIVCISGEKMKTEVEDFFEILYKANPSSVGGAMPDENFYYTK